MSGKYLTLMVIPHNEGRVREFHISRPLIWGALFFVTLCLCALAFYTTGYYLSLNRETRFAVLKAENAELQTQLQRMQDKLALLRQKVDDLSSTDRQMRAWVELSEPGDDVRQMGIGGAIEGISSWQDNVSAETASLLSETYDTLDQLLREASFLEASFDTITASLNQDETTRLHTPSISPISADAESWISSRFGYRIDPFTGRRVLHTGLDIAGRMGTNIVATADGTIEKVGKDPRLGNFVSIDHSLGYRTVYGHMMRLSPLKKGQKVKRGDVIGQMGKSGRTTAPHVHYAVIKNTRAEDPLRYIFDQRGADYQRIASGY